MAKMLLAKTSLNLIGNTPLVEINNVIDKDGARLLAKMESLNPGGSVKDRIAFSMIEEAEKGGKIKPGAVIIEPTSGNTGIGLALVAAVKGYELILTMPETMSYERRALLKSFGATLVLTPGDEGMNGAVTKAEELLEENSNAFIPQQFKNPANPKIHRETTAAEIIEATGGKVDALIAGVGTGGTITGVGEVLKGLNKDVKIIAVEPKNSPVLSGGKPGPHRIQGIGAGFIPEVLNQNIIDDIIQVTDEDAFKMAKELAQQEGLSVGFSSGAAVWASVKIAAQLGKGKIAVTVLPDLGDRYISMEQLFRGV